MDTSANAETNSLQQMWDRWNALPENLREIATNYWDYTGRPTAHIKVLIIQVLDTCTTFGEYREAMAKIGTNFEASDLAMHWDLYMSGMLRLERDLRSGMKLKGT